MDAFSEILSGVKLNGAVFFTAEEGGTGWRRESYDVTSVPMQGQDLRAMTGTAELEKGH